MPHPCLKVDEILRILAEELVESGAKATAATLACCCKSFEDPALDALWETQERLFPLLKSFPGDVWKVNEAGKFSFSRIPTKAEWSRFSKHARRMRKLSVDPSKDLVAADVLLALQLRNGNDPLLRRLETFECEDATESFAPLIPLFLSHRVTSIRIKFATNAPIVMVASTIARLPILCPHIQSLILLGLPKHPVIIEAASEMLLACDQNSLRVFAVYSPLTQEAHRVLYKLPNLQSLWASIQGPTPLPRLDLPSLVEVGLEYNDKHKWLQGFHGANLENLRCLSFHTSSGSIRIGDFLEGFRRVTLSSSIHNTLLAFAFRTRQSWNPNYSSLLGFTQLTRLEIEFSCSTGCSSRVNDDIVIRITQAMPNLETLQLGREPCNAATGITLKGLVALAYYCPKLTGLCIHLRAWEMAEAGNAPQAPDLYRYPTTTPKTSCSLTKIQVGETPLREQDVFGVALTLIQVFPRITVIEYTNGQWKKVAEMMTLIERVGSRVHWMTNSFHTSA